MHQPPKQQLDNTAVAILIVVCATWGLNQIAVKVANEGMSPVWQAAMRSAGAAALV